VSLLDLIPFRSKPAPARPPLDEEWARGLPWSAEEILDALEWTSADPGADLEARGAAIRADAIARRRARGDDGPSG